MPVIWHDVKWRGDRLPKGLPQMVMGEPTAGTEPGLSSAPRLLCAGECVSRVHGLMTELQTRCKAKHLEAPGTCRTASRLQLACS